MEFKVSAPVKECPKAIENQDQFYQYIKDFVDTLESKNNLQKLALEAVMYVLISMSQNENLVIQPFKITITTELAVSAGLGSSASFSVCISAAFLNWAYHQNDKKLVLDVDTLTIISQYAFKCEKIMHGSPSGVDNSVCTYGSIIKFKNTELTPLIGVKSMKVLLVDTKVSRSTKVLVEKVASLKRELPMVYDPILDAMDSIANNALSVIEQIRDLDTEESEVAVRGCYERLMTLININQSLLSACQVSHPALDDICAEARKHGLAAKLTGAGGGGYAYVLLLPDTSDDVVDHLVHVLTERGFGVTLTYLGGAGVHIHG
ncbi:mevalonate kinase isoform X2 [Chelonus insularis]|uniref:mevalonate kinase isoform X2 n=1 Tax=Chelonus insularis TaxID=460826 RepID=UPI00158EE4C4|nr:mevalonate kinase isoform X2 [Chelonus insularis]